MKKKFTNRHILPASLHRLSQPISTHFSASYHTSHIHPHYALSTKPTVPFAYNATTTAYHLTFHPLLLLCRSRTCHMNTTSSYVPQLQSVTSPQPSLATNKISPVYTRSTTNPLISSLLAHPLPILRCLPSLVPTTLLSAKPVSAAHNACESTRGLLPASYLPMTIFAKPTTQQASIAFN